MFRFAERGIGYVSFRNRASVSGLETGRYAKRSEDFARLTFLFFFWNEDFSILGDSFKRETVGIEAKRGETGNNEKMMALFKGMNVRRDFIAGNERILGGARLRDTLTGNSSGFYEYGVTVPLIITV